MTPAQFARFPIVVLALAAAAISGCSTTLTAPAGSTTARADPTVVRPASPARAPQPSPDNVDSIGLRALDTALSVVGAPYRYGGSTPAGFDCSGLVHFAYRSVGIRVPRTTTQLLRFSNGIDLREARQGDLLFFEIDSKADHVGLFIGNGQFVHAPSSGKQVSIASLDDPFWQKSFLSARRLNR